jgi:predicted DNA-binding transcriptional regulator YafY
MLNKGGFPMRVSANNRIQWLHEELVRNTFPNAARLAERFGISRRQAQRDIDFLKKQLGAPIEYDQHIMGYRYTKPFSLPISMKNENDGGLSRMPVNPFGRDVMGDYSAEADSVIIQGQIPYTATLGITDKLTVLEMRSYIISEEARGQFLCEFHNIDRFLCAILTARSGIRIIEPAWLRDKLLHMARKAIDNND